MIVHIIFILIIC